MPLSEREQQLLEQMERALYEEDPRFATQLRSGADGYARRRRYLAAALVGLVGLAVVIGAVTLENIVLGVVGFLVMVAAGAYAVAPQQPRLGTVRPDGSIRPATPRAASSPRTGTFMQRLEQRWDARRERGL